MGEIENAEIGADLYREVVNYCQSHGLPLFEISSPLPWEKSEHDGNWQGTKWANEAGCYVIYGKSEKPLYVGKASLNSRMGFRLYVHMKSAELKKIGARYVQMVITPVPYQAPSLEEYLIEKLDPITNFYKYKPRP